jgi:NhaC family Na+:H+ antiporter
MAATLGVATVAYAPFTFFNFLSPLISVVLAFLGVRMLKAPTPESSSGS